MRISFKTAEKCNQPADFTTLFVVDSSKNGEEKYVLCTHNIFLMKSRATFRVINRSCSNFFDSGLTIRIEDPWLQKRRHGV